MDTGDTTLNYNQTEPRRLRRFRRWTIALAAVSGVLLVATAVLVTDIIFLAQDQARLMRENDNLQKQLAAKNTTTESTAPAADTSLIDNLDTTKLLTAKDVGQGQIPDHYIGNVNAKVVVISYEDFACSHCQALAPIAAQIHADYQDRVLFIHRAFNLEFSGSTEMLTAAEAAYLLGGQDAYWQMLAKLYAGPTADAATLAGYAGAIGLNQDKFSATVADAANNGIATKIARDKQAGLKAGVQGTPTWFVNGQNVSTSDAGIRAALDAALK